MNHCCKNPYEELFHSRIMKLRDNKVHPHLFATLQRLNDKGEKVTASAYIAKEVAIAFIKKPKEKQAIYDPKRNRFKEYEYVYVENIDGDRTNNYDWNLRWITPYDLHLKQKANGKKFIMDLYKHSPIWQNRKNK